MLFLERPIPIVRISKNFDLSQLSNLYSTYPLWVASPRTPCILFVNFYPGFSSIRRRGHLPPSEKFSQCRNNFSPRTSRALSLREHFPLEVRGHFRFEGTFPLEARGHFRFESTFPLEILGYFVPITYWSITVSGKNFGRRGSTTWIGYQIPVFYLRNRLQLFCVKRFLKAFFLLEKHRVVRQLLMYSYSFFRHLLDYFDF